MPRHEDFDWMFDYTLQFLESDKFDCAVMDFVDEKCAVFDDEDENKLVYTEIHKEFCEYIDRLLTENLAEVGITTETFLESCEKARSERDINATVFERLVAMDDFQTFKKIMVKRNTELQLESLRYLKMKTAGSQKVSEGKEDDDDRLESLLSPTELQALKELEMMDLDKQLQDEELQDMLFQSLMEMEIIHRQEELEHAELERALMLSLAAEEERLQAQVSDQQEAVATVSVASDAKSSRVEDADESSAKTSKSLALIEVKAAAPSSPAVVAASPAPAAAAAPVAVAASASPTSATAATVSATATPKKLLPVGNNLNLNADAFADVKPLKMRGNMAPLPSIKHSSAEEEALKVAEELAEKKRTIEEAMRRANQQLAGQRRNEEELRQQVAGVDPQEAERRAKHLKEQRDLILAKKKAERDARVAAEEDRKRQGGDNDDSDAKGTSSSKGFIGALDSKGQSSADSKGMPSDEELAEMRRATMRMALARRMKMDLIQSEEAKIAEMQENQFAEYDRKLQQVEQMREDNRKREYVLSKQLAKQQEQIARNVKLSAVVLNNEK